MNRHSGLSDIFELKKSVFVKNPGGHFTLKISSNQRLGTYTLIYKNTDKSKMDELLTNHDHFKKTKGDN